MAKKQLTEEQKAKLRENLAKARTIKKAKKEGTPVPAPPEEPKEESTDPAKKEPKPKGWVGGHTLDKEPVG